MAQLPTWIIRLTALAYLVTSLALTPVQAANVYQFTDKDGNVLLTNVVGNNKKPTGKRFSHYDTKVKVTYYPDSNIHQYKDWGSSNASVAPSQSRNKNAFDNLIVSFANQHNIPSSLVKAIMHTESGFNPNARSPVGAMGLMQLMPATAKRFGVNSPYDPAQNIEGGVKYLSYLFRKYSGNLEKIIAGYNAGEGNVDKYGGIPPFKETQDYVPRVLKRYHGLYKNNLSLSESTTTQASSSSSPTSSNTMHSTKAHNNKKDFIFDAENSVKASSKQSDIEYTQTALDALR